MTLFSILKLVSVVNCKNAQGVYKRGCNLHLYGRDSAANILVAKLMRMILCKTN